MVSYKLRKQVFSLARSKVLEVGVGTGKNIPYYPEGCEVTAMDFYNTRRLQERLKGLTPIEYRNQTIAT